MAEAIAILEIKETAGQQRVLLLSGPALPHVDTLTFSARTKIVPTQYGEQTEHQLLGEEEQNTSPSGKWDDVRLQHNGPWAAFDLQELYRGEDIAYAVETLRRAGELLQVSFGPWVRYGHIEEASFTVGRAGELAWTIDFAWISRDRLPEPALFVLRPEGGPDAFTAGIEAALEGIDWFEELTATAATTIQDVLDRYVRGPLSVVAAGGLALQQATRFVESSILDVVDVAAQFLDAIAGYRSTVMRMGGIGGVCAGHATDMLIAAEDLTGEAFIDTDDPQAQVRGISEAGAMSRVAEAVLATSGELLAMAQAQAVSQYAEEVYVAKSGDTLLAIARKYYDGDESRWVDIALRNGLSGMNLYAGQEVVIP